MVEATTFLFVAPAIIGLVIGLVELFFVHADEKGMGWMSHGFHAIPTCVLFTYIAMNAHFVAQWLSTATGWTFLLSGWVTYTIPVVIGLIAAIKVKAAAALARGGTVGESLPHALMIGVLIGASAFVWPLIAGLAFLPPWAKM